MHKNQKRFGDFLKWTIYILIASHIEGSLVGLWAVILNYTLLIARKCCALNLIASNVTSDTAAQSQHVEMWVM